MRVWGKAQTDEQSHAVVLSPHLSRLPPFFYFLFPSVTCLSQRPPVRPVLMRALLCFLSRLSGVAVPR